MTKNITTFFVTQQFSMSYHFVTPSNGATHHSKEVEK